MSDTTKPQPADKRALLASVQAKSNVVPLQRTRRAGTTTARRPRGRPATEPRKAHQVLVYLSDEEARWLKLEAADEGRSMSSIVSDALAMYRAAHPRHFPAPLRG